MNELDNKLDYLLKSNAAISITDEWAVKDYAKLIPEIKQVFESVEHHESEDWNRMTGQEWFNRFKAELQRQGAPTLEPRMAYPEEIEANVLQAARRAAGLTEDSK